MRLAWVRGPGVDAANLDKVLTALIGLCTAASTIVLTWAAFFRKSKAEDVQAAEAREIRVSDVLQKLLAESNETRAAEAARFARKEAAFEKRMNELHEENRELAEKLLSLTHQYEMQQREIFQLKAQLAEKR